MNIWKLLLFACSTALCAASASAQFSASGGGSIIPTSGSGGSGSTFPLTLPAFEATATLNVPVAVFTIDSIQVDGLSHSWIGDLQLTLEDPTGLEHLIFLRPGYLNTSGAGSSGDFTGGSYIFVESGGAQLPTSSNGSNVSPGTYNQTFNSGGVIWNSGDAGINNTPMSLIAGPAGTWKITFYDWAGGDVGSFSSWTLNGNGGSGGNSGDAYCFGDGTGANCPCSAFGALGGGCADTSGAGAVLAGTGNADVAGDSLTLDVSGAPPNKPGIFFQGNNTLAMPAGDGILCTSSTLHYNVNYTDAGGAVSQSGFGSNAFSGATINYQYWFRDPANPCGGGSNYTNGWTVTWL